FFGQHNAQWIQTGLPYENQIMVFNNGFGRTGGNYSTIEIINPPVDGFNYTSSLPYLPAAPSWIYNDGNPNNFFAKNISGSQQLSNGNVLFCDGPAGTFKEITESGITLWEFINPVSATGILTQGTTAASNSAFRCTFYPSSYSGFNNQLFSSPTIIENSNSVSSTCTLSTTIDEEILGEETIFVYPNPANEFINVEFSGLSDENMSIEITDVFGKVVQKEISKNENQMFNLNVSSLAAGYYVLKISSGNSVIQKKIIISE
ncbi:MAG: T9SS C-terminal target domain-containing protein, partial [Crocinitomicaceae bacterium]|nr:T9SS C-terminal target domain-containing protein [Crocinitomicaceae bacterium]NDC93198.1 T9SS C-terminal target domain-containing protein [Flavobacteriales bacterium]